MNQCVNQKRGELLVAQALPLFFLFFLLFRSFGLHANELIQTGAFPTDHGIPEIPFYSHRKTIPHLHVLYDRTPFNESIVWLSNDSQGAPIICVQRLPIPYGLTSDEYCEPAAAIKPEKITKKIPEESICWESKSYIIIIQPDSTKLLIKK